MRKVKLFFLSLFFLSFLGETVPLLANTDEDVNSRALMGPSGGHNVAVPVLPPAAAPAPFPSIRAKDICTAAFAVGATIIFDQVIFKNYDSSWGSRLYADLSTLGCVTLPLMLPGKDIFLLFPPLSLLNRDVSETLVNCAIIAGQFAAIGYYVRPCLK